MSVDDRGDSSSLILGFVLTALTMRLPHLQEDMGIRIDGIEPVTEADGTIKALRVFMGSGTYYTHVGKESPPNGTEVDWDAQARFADALGQADPMVQEAFAAQTERWNDLLYALARLAGKPYEGETDEELVNMIAARLAESEIE